jgi:hypothetical protein
MPTEDRLLSILPKEVAYASGPFLTIGRSAYSETAHLPSSHLASLPRCVACIYQMVATRDE